MRQRLRNVFRKNMKNRIIAMLTGIVIITAGLGTLVGCDTKASESPGASPSASASASASVSPGASASVSPSASASASATAEPSGTATDSSSQPDITPPDVSAKIKFETLIGFIGLTKDELLAAISEKPVTVDEGGLGFAKTGIRIWLDTATYKTVAQVLIISNSIDINGVKLGDSINDFEKVFGKPISDISGDAHFSYGSIYLSVVYDTSKDKTVAVYILKDNF